MLIHLMNLKCFFFSCDDNDLFNKPDSEAGLNGKVVIYFYLHVVLSK